MDPFSYLAIFTWSADAVPNFHIAANCKAEIVDTRALRNPRTTKWTTKKGKQQLAKQ